MVRTLLGVIIKYAYISAAIGVALYATLIGLLRTPSFQAHVVYLHKLELTWFRDLNVPEMFGFLHNQVTPFCIKSPGGGDLYAWHILPVELYRKHEQALIAEPSGFVSDITSRLSFELLREDPEARLVLHFHGAGGTVGSGYRASNYRALFAGQPEKIHVLTFDYRGYGRSNGTPSEQDIILDAIAVVDWATNIAGILPSRILIFGQSLGTAVSSAVSEYFTIQSPPVAFAGTILVAPFVIDTYVHRSHCGYYPRHTAVSKIPATLQLLWDFCTRQMAKPRPNRTIRPNQ
jgi:abhydrolase domain-containing protein 12